MLTAPLVPFLRTDTTGEAADSSETAPGSGHSRTSPVYHLPVLYHSILNPPIPSFFTPLHVSLYPLIFCTCERASLLLPKLPALCTKYFRRSKSSATLPVSLPLPRPSFLRRHRPLPIPHPLQAAQVRLFLCFSTSIPSIRSADVARSDQDHANHDQRAPFLHTEDAIIIVSSASLVLFLPSTSLTDPVSLPRLKPLLLCIFPTASTFG